MSKNISCHQNILKLYLLCSICILRLVGGSSGENTGTFLVEAVLIF